MPVTGTESWTVIGNDGCVVEPVERYLAYLTALERSPNTVRAYATRLALWFEFLAQIGVGWADAGVEDVARFVSWLRAPAANVIVLETGTGRRSAATVNRHLAGLFGFYDHHARSGVTLAGDLVAWRRVGRGSYKPFLHHVTQGKPIATRPVKLVVTRRAPRTLDPEQVVSVLAACERVRDRFLLALLAETGMRIGQALGLRHVDFVSRDREVRIVARPDNANGARAKVRTMAVISAGDEDHEAPTTTAAPARPEPPPRRRPGGRPPARARRRPAPSPATAPGRHFDDHGGERRSDQSRPATQPPDPVPGGGVRHVGLLRRRPHPCGPGHHGGEGRTDDLDGVEAPDQAERGDEGVAGPAASASGSAHPQLQGRAAMADRALIARPERHCRRTPRTVRTRDDHGAARGDVLVDGEGAGPYDGHRWQHRLGPLP